MSTIVEVSEVIAVLATALLFGGMTLSSMAAGLLLTIAVTTWPTRQFLMPAINHASDTGASQRFHLLHGLSVIITLGHIVVSGWVLVTFAT